jgi:hypothetical protein
MSVSTEPIPKSPVKLTCHEYVLFPADGNRHEIINGQHYRKAAPNPRLRAIWLLLPPFLSPRNNVVVLQKKPGLFLKAGLLEPETVAERIREILSVLRSYSSRRPPSKPERIR